MADIQNTQQALSDLQVLKQAILRSKGKLALTIDSVDTHLVLNIAAFAVAAGVTIAELCWPQITDDLLFSANVPALRPVAIAFVGGGIAAMLCVAYVYLFLSAKKEKTSFSDFSDRYFSYFKNLSALSDIFVKFCAFALLVLAGKPQWVAPLFVLFIGDVAFQGRLLILSPAASIAFGIASFAAALAMFVLGISSILAPAGLALFVGAWSVMNILQFRRTILSARE